MNSLTAFPYNVQKYKHSKSLCSPSESQSCLMLRTEKVEINEIRMEASSAYLLIVNYQVSECIV